MVGTIVATLITLTSKILDKTPNYEQKKKEQWSKLCLRYNDEVKKLYPDRDDDLIMNLREQIVIFSASFSEEIK